MSRIAALVSAAPMRCIPHRDQREFMKLPQGSVRRPIKLAAV
jgi:hypothetical protein